MPIGKNAIKRVSNNGYSNVKTTAPDMENSEVVEKIQVVEKKSTTPKATTKKVTKAVEAKKPTPKQAEKKPQEKKAPSTPKKSMEKEPDFAPVKTAEKVVKKSETQTQKQDFQRFSLGDDLPYYLL
jgi:hypothetical protein